MDNPAFPMRINKYLAWQKHSTRRGADDLIKEKKVFINGRLAVLGDKVVEGDNVEVRFRGKAPTYVYLAYNKPIGVMTEEIETKISTDTKVFPIGRLDKDSHGLIILTNDGRITERLLGPKYLHEKEYLVRTKEKLRANFKEKMEKGVKIEGEMTAPCKVNIIAPNKFKVILTEGKKHQIRRMCVALFAEVEDLKRIRVMNVKLDDLGEGKHRPILGDELQKFLHALDLG